MKTNFFTGTMWRKLTFWLSVAAVVLPSLGVAAYAQETGQIAGTVTDPTGAAIPNAVVSAKNAGTNAVRTATSNGTGAYLFTGLTPAVYQISVQPTGGFGTFTG